VISCGGSWTADTDSAFTHNSNTVTFTATATGKTITTNTQSFNSLTFNGAGGGWTFQDNVTVTTDFTITAGAVTGKSGGTITVGGNWSNSDTFTYNSTNITFNATSTGKTITVGSGTLANNLTFNGTGGGWTFQDDVAVANNFTITAGTVTGPSSGTISVGNNWDTSGGTFTHNNSEVILNATDTSNTITSGSNGDFYKLTFGTAEASNSLSGWDNRIKLTIDKNDIDSNLSNFPVLVYLSTSSGRNNDDVSAVFDELQSNANRKKIAVTTSDGTTQCYVEIEKWDDATEQAWLWVKVPSVSSSADTILYLYYDADQSDNTTYVGDTDDTVAQNVWDDNHKGVWHLTENASGTGTSGLYKDSTSNNNDGNDYVSTTGKSGEIDGGQEFDGVDDYLNVADSASLHLGTGSFTIEAWLNASSFISNDAPTYIRWLSKSNYCADWQTNDSCNWFCAQIYEKGKVNAGGRGYGNAGIFSINTADGAVTLDTWHRVAIVVDRSTSKGYIYVNGVNQNGTGASISNLTGNLDMDGAVLQFPATWADYPGLMDEVRISSGTPRTAAWFKAGYESGKDDLIDFESSASGGWTFQDNVTVATDFTITNGAVTGKSGGSITVGGSWSNSGTFTYNDTNVTFTATATGKTITTNTQSFYNLTFNGTGGGWTFQDNVDVDNNLTITNGTVTGKSAGTITVGGNWLNSGTFTHNNGTVTFDGTGAQQVTTGGSDWNNIIITNASGSVTFTDSLTCATLTNEAAGSTLYFASGETVTITDSGGLTLTGASGNLITLGRYGGSGTDQWKIDPQGGNWSVSYVNITDSVNLHNTYINPSNSTDSENNTNVFTQLMYTLTVQVIGNGSTTPAVGDHLYAPGTVVDTSDAADSGWQFDGWSETAITMDSDKTVTATFTELQVQAEVWHVDASVVESGDGKSWQTAFKTIQEAIDAVATDEDEIWVKKGTYALTAAVQVDESVPIYGGFVGTEDSRDDRNWQTNETTVNGGGTVTCFHVTADATIDGFTITNESAADGGGINIDNDSSPNSTNCTFSENTASSYGGGIYNGQDSSPTIVNCIFSENTATYGGGFYNEYRSSATITNCSFSTNSADGDGGGIYNERGSSPAITNCIIWENTASSGSEIYDDDSSSTVTYCDVKGGYEDGGSTNIDVDPSFVDPDNGDFQLQKGSPCIDVGNNNASSLPSTDLKGNLREIDGDIDGTATVDMGAYEYAPDIDSDGITDQEENAGPNSGDGNNDGTLDSLQDNVTTLLTYDQGNYVTLTSPAGTTMNNCNALDTPSELGRPSELVFPYGFFDFVITGVNGGTTTLTLYVPDGDALTTYYKYGPTPDDPSDHWYEFLYDGQTGAVIDGNTITLYFVDGERGDDDLEANGTIVDQGGPGANDDDVGATHHSLKWEGCFITAAAHGSYMEHGVVALREFRDSFLLTNALGQAAVVFVLICATGVFALRRRRARLQ